MMDPDVLGIHEQEVRRGSVVVACLVSLHRPDYGYALLEGLAAAGIAVDANTLYPLLRRLERQGLLISTWNTDAARPRKFYRTSQSGDELGRALLGQWRDLDRALNALTTGDRT